MVEVQQLRPGRAGTVERVHPHLDQRLVLLVADAREHPIGRARPILVRGLKRRPTLPTGRVVDADQIKTGEEGRRMRLLTRPAQRTGRQRHLPARPRQSPTQRARHLGRAAARKEEQPRNDAATGPASRSSHRTRVRVHAH